MHQLAAKMEHFVQFCSKVMFCNQASNFTFFTRNYCFLPKTGRKSDNFSHFPSKMPIFTMYQPTLIREADFYQYMIIQKTSPSSLWLFFIPYPLSLSSSSDQVKHVPPVHLKIPASRQAVFIPSLHQKEDIFSIFSRPKEEQSSSYNRTFWLFELMGESLTTFFCFIQPWNKRKKVRNNVQIWVYT